MIFFLYGPDNYRKLERKKELLKELKKKYPDLTVDRFYLGEENEFLRLKDFLSSRSLFGEKKLAAIEGAEEVESKKIKEILEPILTDKTTAVLIFAEKKPVKTLEFLLKKPVLAEEFEYFSGKELLNYADSLAKKAGVSILPEARDLLLDLYPKNTWGLLTEIQKLALSGKKTITKKDIEGLGLETAVDYWPLLNSLKNHKLENRLWALKKLSDQKEQAAKTFNIFSAIAKDKVKEFAEYDVLIKSGKLDYEEVLLDLVLK